MAEKKKKRISATPVVDHAPGAKSVRAGTPTAEQPGDRSLGQEANAASKASDGKVPLIIGIGASAGGLAALEQFMKHTPLNSGMAIVIVQHLGPEDQGMLAELLSRRTELPVQQVEDGVRLLADHVYVAPARSNIRLNRGVLRLQTNTGPVGLNLPIDLFFRSLAQEQKDRSVGVILSGTGTDGTLGLQAISEEAGATFVQDPADAKFDGMPRSAIKAGRADVVAAAGELPQKIMAYRRSAPQHDRTPPEESASNSLNRIFALLRARTGNDFSQYKTSTIHRRIERRMGLHQIAEIASYARFLRENPAEVEKLFRELLINVTCFFRDHDVWKAVIKTALPKILEKRQGHKVLRAWIPGCSTGEEAYSIAMAFKEAITILQPRNPCRLQIFATDIDTDAIDKARPGLFPDNIAVDVSPERLNRFFLQEEGGYRVTKEIREMVIFAPQNIITDPPFTRLDILSCRNLLIYLSAELQRKLLPLFHYSLNRHGILLLGSAETIGTFSNLFSSLDPKLRIYERVEASPNLAVNIDFPMAKSQPRRETTSHDAASASRGHAKDLSATVDGIILSKFSPAGVLCNDQGDVVYISRRVGEFLEPAIGKANVNIFAMAREGLRFDLSSAFGTALRQDGPVHVYNIVIATNGHSHLVDLTVQKLTEPTEVAGAVLVLLIPGSPRAHATAAGHTRVAKSARLAELETDNRRRREEVQTVREEMQTSQEELKSTNEELQSTNEELQSANEELTTSKEELQSLNEELQTVNAELQAKVDELSRANNDMKNLLNSTEIATLFLDDQLNVRRFTTPTTKIIKLIPSDVGRPITDITSNLDYNGLADDAHTVLRTLVYREQQVGTRDGQRFMMRITPYRTLENVIEGIVITFTNASATFITETDLREHIERSTQLVESLPVLIWTCNANGICDYLSRQWAGFTGASSESVSTDSWLAALHPQEQGPAEDGWEKAVKQRVAFERVLRLRSSMGGFRWFKCRVKPLINGEGEVVKWFGSATDIHDLVSQVQSSERYAGEAFIVLTEEIASPVINLDANRFLVATNQAAELLFNGSRQQLLGKRLEDVIEGAGASSLLKALQHIADHPENSAFTVETFALADGREYEVRLTPWGKGMTSCMMLFKQKENTH